MLKGQCTQKLNSSWVRITVFVQKERKIALIVVLVLLVLSTGIVIVANLLPETEKTLPLLLSYPETLDIKLGFGGNQSIFTIIFLLKTQGYIAEDVQIQVINATCISYIPKNMTVKVIFPNAIDSDLKRALSHGSAVIANNQINFLEFEDNQQIFDENTTVVTNIHVFGPARFRDISFPVSGDYSPTVRIFIEGQQEIDYTFSQIKVHVLSASEAQGEKNARMNLWLSYAIFGLSITGIVWLIHELFKKEEEKQVYNIKINIAPDNISPPPAANKPKPINRSHAQPFSEGTTNPEPNRSDSKTEVTNKTNPDSTKALAK
jgi:hypothetical protein